MARSPLPPFPSADDGPASPCVRDCCLDEADVCLGCGRHIDEILRWRQSTPVERERILADAARRQDARRRKRSD
ncbi:DUF1289 domain-containing protein [Arenimonas sp.]|uniref:DUF1289 domain-containing protein n=1 Tax=Arenimonas sp. TaxID=1872635 RepID=UPI0039E69878